MKRGVYSPILSSIVLAGAICPVLICAHAATHSALTPNALSSSLRTVNHNGGGEAVSWQLSETPQMEMGVRDKFGTLGGYVATFVVRGPKQQKAKTTVHVKGDEFKSVRFPEDFPGYVETNGKFKWVCLVQGKAVVSGAFSFVNLKSGGTELIVPRNY